MSKWRPRKWVLYLMLSPFALTLLLIILLFFGTVERLHPGITLATFILFGMCAVAAWAFIKLAYREHRE